jgi:hypothetical protein
LPTMRRCWVSTASKARVDTAYQRLREHLAYLGLTTASEELAPALERARTLRLSAVEVLEDLMAKEAEATRTRRLAGRLRFAHYPLRKTLADFEFDYQPWIDRKTLGELSALRLSRSTATSCCLARQGSARHTWRSRLGSRPPRPATAGCKPRTWRATPAPRCGPSPAVGAGD